MKFTKFIVLFLFIIFTFSMPVNAINLVQNGDFESGNSNNWTLVYQYAGGTININSDSAYTGGYGADLQTASVGDYASVTIRQSFNLTNVDTLSLDLKINSVDTYNPPAIESGLYVYYGSYNNIYTDYYTCDWKNVEIDVSGLSGIQSISFCSFSYYGLTHIYLDNIIADDGETEINSIVFNPNVSISNQSQQYFDYNINDTWDGYYYFVRSIWEPETYNLYLNENWLNIDMSGENIKLLYEFVCYQSNYSLELYATTYPTFDIGYAHLIAESPIIFYDSSYIPPEEPEEPEEPEIPDPEPEPDPEPDPPIPPTQPNETNANQSINVSWTGEYYNAVNNTFGGLCSPIYNFTNWSLSPIYSLNNSIGEFNYYMNESFTQTAQDSSILYESINTIFGAIHPKIRNVITYYLIWVVLLIVLKKD